LAGYSIRANGNIDARPQIAAAPGRVVLTTVSHLNNYLFTLTLTDSEGAADTLGITGFHKVYSQERGWVDARDLRLDPRNAAEPAVLTEIDEAWQSP